MHLLQLAFVRITNAYVIFLTFLLLCTEVVSGSVIGRVFIGTPSSNESLIFSFNENIKTGGIPIFIQLFNDTQITGSYDGNVNVTCELVPTMFGYSQVTYVIKTISGPSGIAPIKTEVTFSINAAGRETGVQCWGVSIDFADYAQFTKESSLSQTVPFAIRKHGTVNICSDLVIVPNDVDVNTGSFVLELSEAVIDYNVTVSCSNTPALPGKDTLVLKVLDFIMVHGEKNVKVQYEIVNKGSPVFMWCDGQSLDQGNFGQFVKSTSAGDRVLFVLQESDVRLYPSRSVLRMTDTKVFLVLEHEATTQVTFTCQATVVNTTEEALHIASNPFCQTLAQIRPPPRPVSTTDSTTTTTPQPNTDSNTTFGQWELSQDSVLFEAGEIYAMFELQRREPPFEASQEMVVVTCCAPPDNNNSPLYMNKSAAMLVIAQTQPAVSINWTAADTIDSTVSESVIINPAFVNVAPCPCDLTEDTCDHNCCCDQVCTSDDIDMFSCTPYLEGGFPPEEPRYLCTSSHTIKPDWFPLMCVEYENSAFLGYFYYPRAGLTTQTEYNIVLEEAKPPYTYRETELRSPNEGVSEIGYHQGVSVKTGLPHASNADVYKGPNYRLTLPRRVLNGACIRTAPVRYLQDSSDECVFRMTSEMCTMDSILSAQMYVQSTQQTHRPCPRSTVVLLQQEEKKVTTTYTNYHCTDSLAGYVYSLQTAEDVLPLTTKYKFAYEIPEGEEASCHFDNITSAYICNNTRVPGTIPPSSEQPQRCLWDDGYTGPPEPKYNETSKICHSAVLEVYYNFTWQGSEILELNATFVIGDVPLQTEYVTSQAVEYTEAVRGQLLGTRENMTQVTTRADTVLTQVFKVEYFPLNPNNTEDNTTERYKRSGNPGYEMGLPVISGISVFNESSSELLYIDTNGTSRLSTWLPGSDGLCQNSSRQVADFGEDMSGSCIIRLGWSDLEDCQSLRQLVLNQQDLLMPSNYVSLGGDPDRFTLTTEWLDIFREDLSWLMPNFTIDLPPTSPEPGTNSTTLEPTLASSVVPPVENETLVSQLTGLCHNIPAGIHVDVLYTTAGLSNWKPIYNIVGAKISYTLHSWQMNCGGAAGVKCHNNTDEGEEEVVHSFVLSSSVAYIQVPAMVPAPKTKYELDHQLAEHACLQEICWRELLYPFMDQYTGDSHMYVVAFSLTALMGIVGLFAISKPWW